MVQAPSPAMTLADFLNLPDTKPASEFIHDRMIQKPLPPGEHSVLQVELCKAIDRVAEPERVAKAFSELRCVFGGAAIVPDVSVFRWSRLPRKASGRIANRFEIYPDWAIEILSPDQAQTRPLENLLHCAENGTELGWLLDPSAETILTVSDNARVKLYRGNSLLPVLSGLALSLTAAEVFGWLALPD